MNTDSNGASKRISDTLKKLNTNGVQNGNISKFRIIASGLIGLVTIVAGSVLLYHQINVPDLYWYIAIGALGGVVGIDLLASIIKGVKPQ